MEPRRGMVTREIRVGATTIAPATSVWLLDEAADGGVTVEHRDRALVVPVDAVVPCPVPAPPLERLRAIDRCFGRSDEHFEELHRSDAHLYRILRCREHGRLFLEDTRGGILAYRRLIAVEAGADAFDEIWRRYHSMSDDWLDFLGIAR